MPKPKTMLRSILFSEDAFLEDVTVRVEGSFVLRFRDRKWDAKHKCWREKLATVTLDDWGAVALVEAAEKVAAAREDHAKRLRAAIKVIP